MICGIILITALATLTADAASYKKIYNKWTRSDKSYSLETLEPELIWRAIMISGELIDAQIKFLDEKGIHDDIGLLKEKEEFSSSIAFAVDLYSAEGLRGFSMDPNSVWKIYLTGASGEEISPLNIKPITITPTIRALYPDMTKWSKLFLVEFPKIDLGKGPELTIRSVVAESTVKWKMR